MVPKFLCLTAKNTLRICTGSKLKLQNSLIGKQMTRRKENRKKGGKEERQKERKKIDALCFMRDYCFKSLSHIQ